MEGHLPSGGEGISRRSGSHVREQGVFGNVDIGASDELLSIIGENKVGE